MHIDGGKPLLNKSSRKMIYGLVIIIIVWALVNKYTGQEPSSITIVNDTKVKVAFIEIWGNYTNTVQLFEEIIEPEINQYAQEQNANITFDYIVINPEDGGPDVFNKIKELAESNVKYIIGSNCVACIAYSFIEENDMMLISSSSTQPLFSIVDEHMFRVCPADDDQAKVIKKMMESRGVSQVAVLRRGDIWADEVYSGFIHLWGLENILIDIRYPAETTDFSKELRELNMVISSTIVDGVSSEKIGVLVLSYAEIEEIVNQTTVFPSLEQVTWFGSEGTAMLDKNKWVDSIEGFGKLGVLSPIYSVASNEHWEILVEKYVELTGEIPDTGVGYDYDAAWLIALTIIQSGSQDRTILSDQLSIVASNYVGVTGSIKLDEYGDRDNASYDIWGYVQQDMETSCIRVGYFDGDSKEVFWSSQVFEDAHT
jgi:branched-chain amino acid transport system substrate-binding protein